RPRQPTAPPAATATASTSTAATGSPITTWRWPMSDEESRDSNPLNERGDALLRRVQPQRGQGDVPVLTEIVTDELARRRTGRDRAALGKIALELGGGVLRRLGPELERLVNENLTRALDTALGKALDAVRAEL